MLPDFQGVPVIYILFPDLARFAIVKMATVGAEWCFDKKQEERNNFFAVLITIDYFIL